MQKKGQLVLKHKDGYIQKYRWVKSIFYENDLDLTSFSQDLSLFSWFFFLGYIFFRTLFTVILFFKTLIGSPHTNLGKKVPGIQNTRLYFQWHVFQGLEKIRTFFQNLFPGFFPRNFFPLDYIDSYEREWIRSTAVNSKW